jgi:2-polyprenyl-3-methyl-5-hydroxy-6-metoxy-1,4-benzoquinol methylase
MNHHKLCLVCNSEKIRDLKGYETNHLCKCSSCGFVFCKPIPTAEELKKHYEGYGRNDYLSPITIKRYNELLDEMEPYRKNNRMIDVGCGIGYFLEEAKKRGWEVYGTEYTDEAVEICRQKGIIMHKGALNSVSYEPNYFDVITSFEVIEHINNPREELEHFYNILRPNGLVYVTTPNFNSLLRYYLKSSYDNICYPEHLSYYTPKTIKRLFTSKGFKPLKIETTGISITRLKTSSGKENQAYISPTSDDEKLRNQLETKRYLQLSKLLINKVLTFLGKGDSLKAWFVKK